MTENTHALELQRLAARIGGLGAFLPRVLAPPPASFVRRGVTEGGGHFVYGPRFELPKGDYVALFWLEVGAGIASPRLVFDAALWREDEPTICGESEFSLAAGAARIALFSLRFAIETPGRVELRAWSDVPLADVELLGVHLHRFTAALLGSEPDLAAFEPRSPAAGSGRRHGIEALALGGSEQNRSLELWLAFDRAQEGDALFRFAAASGEVTTIELVEARKAAQFLLRDGRLLFHLALPNRAAARLFGEARLRVELAGTNADLGTVTVPGIALADSVAPRHPVRLGARGAVRLRGWALDDLSNPAPAGTWHLAASERQPAFVRLRDGAIVEFAAAETGFFVFETGPDCGVVELAWGAWRRSVDLARPTAGLLTAVVPDTFDGAAGVAAWRRPQPDQTAARVEIFALGAMSEASSGTEVVVEAVWRNYPLLGEGLERLRFDGAFESRPSRTILRLGRASFAAGTCPAVQLRRHNAGGLCAIRHRLRVVTVDLYAAREASLLVFPTLDTAVSSPQAGEPFPGGEPVHPALRHLFRRLRPAWLDPPEGAPS